MSGTAIDVITVAREYGAGGSDLANAVGERLGWPVLDREMVGRMAARLGLDERTVATLDEHPPTLLARFAAMMQVLPGEAPVIVDPADVMHPDAVADAAAAVVRDAVAQPPVVIVGHGAQCLLHDRARTLHLRLVAPAHSRAARLRARGAADPASVASDIRRMDEARSAYIRRYHASDWRDPMLYDLEINTGRVSIDEAAEMVVALVRSRGAGSDAGITHV
jgi:cytidylate kinase